MKIKMKILAIPVCLALMTTSAHSALLITVTGDANGSGSVWVFNGFCGSVATGGTLSSLSKGPTINYYWHFGSALSGEIASEANYNNSNSIGHSITGGSVSGSKSGAFTFDGLFLNSDNSNSDDFAWLIGSQPSHSFQPEEIITFSNYTLQTNLDITTFGEGATAITTNGDSFTVTSTTAAIGDLAMTFTAQSVPEPSSSALLGLGGLSLLVRRRR